MTCCYLGAGHVPEIHANTPIDTQGPAIIFFQLEMYKSTDTLKKSLKKKNFKMGGGLTNKKIPI